MALLLGSTALGLFAAEIVIRYAKPQIPLGEFEQRYEVDGRPSAIPCYFTNDSVMPFVLRRNFHHRIADRFFAPTPVAVDTDSFGYRNDEGARARSKIVLVGDSVVFGFAAAPSATLSASLTRTLGEPVYNLGIPGAGPETYMVMLRRYLQTARPTLIVIGFYRGNDPYELSIAWWNELARCAAPASKIHRADFVPYAAVYPTWIANSWLKHSHLAAAVISLLTLPRFVPSDADLVRLHDLLSKNALSALDRLRAPPKERLDVQKTAIRLAKSLLVSGSCLTASDRSLLERYQRQLQNRDADAAWRTAKAVSDSIVARRCDPIDVTNLQNAAISFRYYAVIRPGQFGHAPQGDLLAYDDLLRTMRSRRSFKDLWPEIDSVDRVLALRSTAASAKITTLSSHLDKSHPLPKSCDATELFLNEISRLAAAAHAKLAIIDIPGEFQLRYFADHPATRQSDICKRAGRHGIPCLDLLPKALDEYTRSKDSLYVDMAHFNERGSRKFAEWTAPWLRQLESR